MGDSKWAEEDGNDPEAVKELYVGKKSAGICPVKVIPRTEASLC
jgi:hypothetical protein